MSRSFSQDTLYYGRLQELLLPTNIIYKKDALKLAENQFKKLTLSLLTSV